MRMNSTFTLILALSANPNAWAARDIEHRGGSLALPDAPTDFSRPGDREAYAQRLKSTLNRNTVTVQERKNFDEETLNRTLRQMETQKGSGDDKTIVSLQHAWAELQNVLAEAAPPDEFANDDAPPPAPPAKDLVKQVVGWIRRTKVVADALPPTFVKWSEIFTAAEPRVRTALQGVNAVIDQIEEDRDKMAAEVGEMQVLLATLNEQLSDYTAKTQQLEERLAADGVTDEERLFITNTLLYELRKDTRRIVGELAYYTMQLGKRQQYLELADPVLTEVKANAVLAFPAMQSAAGIAACAYRLEKAQEVSAVFANAYAVSNRASSERLNRLANRLKNAGPADLMTQETWDKEAASLDKTQAVITEIGNKDRADVRAELAELRQYAAKVTATGEKIEQNLARIKQIDPTLALPPRR